jgi:hypothetical protein
MRGGRIYVVGDHFEAANMGKDTTGEKDRLGLPQLFTL